MKKIITICLLVWSGYMSHAVKAFELPTILEKNVADELIHWVGNFKNRFIQEGIFNIFYVGMENPFHNDRWVTQEGRVRIAVPLLGTTINHRSLYRFEYNFIKITDKESDIERNSNTLSREFTLHKAGLSGRYIINTNFIMGGYLFVDIPSRIKYLKTINWMINPGMELIWPPYIITLDGVWNPQNLLDNFNNRFYKGSIKIGQLRPEVLDIFSALSIEKYPQYSTKYIWTLLGIKFHVPFKKWDINKWLAAGLQITYTKKVDTWISYKNLGYSLYLQVNPLKNKPQNSLRGYLRMPIERHIAMPCHPNQNFYNRQPSTPSTPSMSSTPDKLTMIDNDPLDLTFCPPEPMVEEYVTPNSL